MLLLCLVMAATASARDLALVVHKSNATKAVSMAELSRIFKAVTRRWPDGREVTLVMHDPASPEMRLAVQKIYGMGAQEVKALITSANRSRRGSILLVNSNEALVKAVETNPGSVGLVDVYSITGRVNVVKVEGKSPLEVGYPLRGN